MARGTQRREFNVKKISYLYWRREAHQILWNTSFYAGIINTKLNEYVNADYYRDIGDISIRLCLKIKK